MRVRDRFSISTATQQRLSRSLSLALIGLFAVGIERGNVGIIVNSGVAILVTQLPALLERDYGIALDPALTLWITSAAFFHALGTVGLPGAEENFYVTIWWWDHFTHALSSSVVAAVGYTTVRALDEHTDEISIPSRFMFVFLLLFVMAFGVLWEVIEFSITLAASATGNDTILTQFGLTDTMLDLVFDTIGAIIVAIWGTAHLTDVVGHVETLLNRQSQ
ncbi:hypothetical protein [Haloarcula marismortui]|uniref:Membrane-spanning protein n=1 Tax=Haloarcula marismortui ATCC 33800 TaxID=662476 RepID=M0JV97_9EURY|nr:hypothetical protein [Haloarcula sinaiiensis]EMA13087.1 hypothetical protein C436_11758 [Haloarcula sinaiiensis ATCC 33800]QUJ70751.1 hypothetical protein KDQ40_08405 [Haloarcula sinaiiensis ATCC 33800]